MRKRLMYILLLLFAVWGFSCSGLQESTTRSDDTRPATETTAYTTAFPTQDVSEQLQEARQSIIRIISTVHYDTYVFEKPQMRMADIQPNTLADKADQRYTDEESTAATSIILDLNSNGETLLITCAHAVTSPDTLITYYADETIAPKTFIQTISIKNRQTNLLFTPSELSNFEIIAENSLSDLALLKADLNAKTQANHQSLNFAMGRMEDLQLGSFLYILGFPKGFPMVTRGIASTRGLRPHRFFITDALFNPGISGGLVISSRDNFRSFEWIGMARSATASKETVLVPHPDRDEEDQNISRPYMGQPFTNHKNRISYGITQAIPINEIRSFLDEHRDLIGQHGFSF